MEILKTILTARLTQILVRYTAVLIVTLTGWSTAKTNDFISAGAEVAVAAVMFGADHVISRYRRKELEAEIK